MFEHNRRSHIENKYNEDVGKKYDQCHCTCV